MKVANNKNNDIVNIAKYYTPGNNFLNNVIGEIYHRTPLNEFKESFSEVAQATRINASVDKELMRRTQKAFRKILSYVNTMLYHTPSYNKEQRTIIGKWVHQEFLSFCLLGNWPARSLNKPQNIAGDHHTIKQIYRNADQEKRDVGHVVNYCFLQEPACKAVKNRKSYVQDKILNKIESAHNESVKIASIASGPAEEIFDVYELLGKENRHLLKAVGIDIDKRACASVDDRIYEEKLNNYFSTHAINVLKLSPPPKTMQNHDLVYSMGLIDYFKDRATVKILNAMHSMLKPGGEIIVGNFHDTCESRVFLDHILDWKLIYRTEEDMHRLFEQSLFKGAEVTVDFESEGVNMLARCKKQ